ncbi:CocE/NonD family hydrolase [Nonomuraea mesophila]|uniref:CocE/NonD family hydrolase n=2 Tax=Nonomuraea mesophila TaxID=2530382 RepID=A0A4R5FII2_9ACTN|nr:CocE/NonD family hydrolase [Nonomuraea mesophila]
MRMTEHVHQGEPPRAETPPQLTSVTRLHLGLRVPMRDGVELAMDLRRPDLPGPLPVILMRTPYDKVGGHRTELYERFAQAGYIIAFSDCRGRFNSDGVFQPYADEADDGYDTVEWIAAQEWCDGNIGMIGGSYAGQTQWFAASRRPPHLKAIVPMCSPPGSPWRNEPILGGCFMLGMAEWAVAMGARSWQTADPGSTLTGPQPYFDTLPLAAVPGSTGESPPWWREMTEHPTFDDYWRRRSYDNHAEMDVASLNVTGWWDLNFPGAPSNYQAMRNSRAKSRQKLVIGPWPHWINTHRELNEVDFGDSAIIELNDYIQRFFDRWLKGVPNGIDEEKPVHLFVVGANEWWAEDDWPLPDAEDMPLYLHSGGQANTLDGDGILTLEPPSMEEPPDSYRYDPADCGARPWSLHDGPIDDRPGSKRSDCLCYTSEPLTEPLDVVGWITCRLYASSSALDTDWHLRLTDVHPDGTARFLCRGALRARFRHSFEHPEPLEPGIPTLFEIGMDACGVRFLPGHRIRVEISSSGFSRYDRNTNSGASNFFTDDTVVVAEQRVYHSPDLASRILLPVVRRHAGQANV